MSISITHKDIHTAYQAITATDHNDDGSASASFIDLIVLEYDDAALPSTIDSKRVSTPQKALRLALSSGPSHDRPTSAAARLKPLLNPGEVLFALIKEQGKILIVQYLAADISGVRRARALVHGRAVCSHFAAADANLVITKPDDLTDSIIRTHLKLDPHAPSRLIIPQATKPVAAAAAAAATSSSPLSSSPSAAALLSSPIDHADGRRNSARSVGDGEWRSLRSRTPVANNDSAAQAAFAAHQQRLSMAGSIMSMPEGEDEATRLQREKDEFLAFQREEALRSEAIDRERQRRREKELIRRDEAKREEVMRRLRLEQERDAGTTSVLGMRGSPSPNGFAHGAASPSMMGMSRSGTPSKTPSSHIGNGRRSSSTGLITPPLSVAHEGSAPRSPSRGPPSGPPPSVPPPTLREADLQPIVLSKPLQSSPSNAAPILDHGIAFPRDSVHSLNSSVLAHNFASARPSTGMSKAIDGVELMKHSDEVEILPNGLVISRTETATPEEASTPSPAASPVQPAGTGTSHLPSTTLSASDQQQRSRSRSRSGDSLDPPNALRATHDRFPSTASTSTLPDRVISSRTQKRLLEMSGHGGEHWISRHGRRRSEERDVGDIHGYSDASYVAHQRLRAASSADVPVGRVGAGVEKALPAVPVGGQNDDGTADAMARRAKDARRRAVAAEAAALAQIERARAEQRRLALQVSEAERRDRERSEAEAAARAKWAREQAERDRLDAFERSKLEAEERRRRSAVESLRKEEGRRAEEARKERLEREREEREAIEMGERRRKDAEEREKRLGEEAERRKREEEEVKGKEESERLRKKKKLEEVRKRLESGEQVGTGWVSAQMGDAVVWRRRYLHFSTSFLLLSKTDSAADLATPLDRLDLGNDNLERLSDAYEETMMLHSFKLVLRRGAGSSEDAHGDGEEQVVVHLATDSLDDKETLLCVLELLGGRTGSGTAATSAHIPPTGAARTWASGKPATNGIGRGPGPATKSNVQTPNANAGTVVVS